MSKGFIIFLLSAFIIVGLGFFAVLHWGSQLPTPVPGTAPSPAAPPAPPPPPVVTFSEQKAKTGNVIYITWANLPDGSTELEIFRSPKGKNQWTLWQTIPLTGADLANGTAQFNIGKADYSNYDFYTEALGTGGNGGTVTSTSTLWTSEPTPPVVTTSTPPVTPPSNNGGTNNPTSTAGNPTTTPNQPPPTNNPTSTPSSTPVTPSGTPYYSPQVQISSYGQTPAGNFWVQHIDQTIQVGWQNLPSITESIVISRATSTDGPWVPLLAQENPGENGSYAIQVADATVDEPYYYLMDADAGTTTIATYGPFYLPPVGQ